MVLVQQQAVSLGLSAWSNTIIIYFSSRSGTMSMAYLYGSGTLSDGLCRSYNHHHHHIDNEYVVKTSVHDIYIWIR